MRISDWSSDVCSSDLLLVTVAQAEHRRPAGAVDVLLPIGVVDVAALAPGDLGELGRLPCGNARGAVGHLWIPEFGRRIDGTIAYGPGAVQTSVVKGKSGSVR